jgi:hypothetical protein
MIDAEVLSAADDDAVVILYLDESDIPFLIQQLTRLLQDERCDHIHLFSEPWGGSDLSGSKITEEGHPIQHIKIMSKSKVDIKSRP